MTAIRYFGIVQLVVMAFTTSAMGQKVKSPPREVFAALDCFRSACRFQQGEVIRVRLSIWATAPGYAIDGIDGLRERGREGFIAEPAGETSDPLDGSMVVMTTVGPSSLLPLTPGIPFQVQLELNHWLRFGHPGVYQVRASSSRVALASGSRALLRLTSDPLKIEIVAPEPKWQKEQLARIIPDLPKPDDWRRSPDSAAAIRSLAYLASASDDALSEIRQRLPERTGSAPGTISKQYERYGVEWEMARLELLRHKSTPGQ
jgi:hypothetical protein